MNSKQLNNLLVLARHGLSAAAQNEDGGIMAELWMDWKACEAHVATLKKVEARQARDEADKAAENGDDGIGPKEAK